MRRIYKLWKGRKVEIWSGDKKKSLGIGKYVGSEIYDGRKCGLGYFNSPKFKLGKKTIYGFECWWIPVMETKLIHKLVRKER